MSGFVKPGAWVRRVALNATSNVKRRRAQEAVALRPLGSGAETGAPASAGEPDEELWRAVRELPSSSGGPLRWLPSVRHTRRRDRGHWRGSGQRRRGHGVARRSACGRSRPPRSTHHRVHGRGPGAGSRFARRADRRGHHRRERTRCAGRHLRRPTRRPRSPCSRSSSATPTSERRRKSTSVVNRGVTRYKFAASAPMSTGSRPSRARRSANSAE